MRDNQYIMNYISLCKTMENYSYWKYSKIELMIYPPPPAFFIRDNQFMNLCQIKYDKKKKNSYSSRILMPYHWWFIFQCKTIVICMLIHYLARPHASSCIKIWKLFYLLKYMEYKFQIIPRRISDETTNRNYYFKNTRGEFSNETTNRNYYFKNEKAI